MSAAALTSTIRGSLFGLGFVFFSLENITVAGEEAEGDMNGESSMEAYTRSYVK